MTQKEKERKRFLKMYKAMVDLKGEPDEIYIDGYDLGSYTGVFFVYGNELWRTEIKTLSHYNYINIKELENNE